MRDQGEQLVLHLPRLRRYARALVKDPDQAEDLVQETVARALGRLHFWRRETNMRAWLFTIMHNQFVNEVRRARNRPDRLPLDDRPHSEASAACAAESCAGVQDIETALMQLPHEQRAVLLLVSLEGLSYQEVARVLDIRKGTVMSRLHRARQRMRGLLNHSSEPGQPVGHIRSIR